MTDDKLHATWGPIPPSFPAGNDWLRDEGSPIRHYLNHSDGRWHLGVPDPIDYVPYATLVPVDREQMLADNRKAIADELARGPIAPPVDVQHFVGWVRPDQRPHRSRSRRALAWLDDVVHPRFPVPRVVVLLGLVALAVAAAGYLSLLSA